MAKGSQFERDFCRDLSEWWCPGRDDIFWRTDGSGARATVRSKKGKTTAGSSGDIGCIDPGGAELLKVFAFELKRGYSKSTIYDVFDKGPVFKPQAWEIWIGQAEASRINSGALSWAIIARRDRRVTTISIPCETLLGLCDWRADSIAIKIGNHCISTVRWDDFKWLIRPVYIKQFLARNETKR